METKSPESCSTCSACWRLPLLLAIVLVAIVLSRATGMWDKLLTTSGIGKPVVDDELPREHVSLAIDFGNGRRQDFDALAWHEGLTVADLLGLATALTTTQKGFGQGSLLTAINGVANEGADGNNWTYEVNGQSGDRSFAVFELRPGDRVLWTFGPRR